MARRQQGRVTRQGAARHSAALSKSASGDPRDRRRAAVNLTDADLDPTALVIEDGRITIVRGKASGPALPEVVDQTTGTASGSVPELPDLDATPASVTALRDELVQVTLPAIRDALATLTAAVNAMRKEAR